MHRSASQVLIGRTDDCTVTIEDNDTGGDLKFASEYVSAKESAGRVVCTVVRGAAPRARSAATSPQR